MTIAQQCKLLHNHDSNSQKLSLFKFLFLRLPNKKARRQRELCDILKEKKSSKAVSFIHLPTPAALPLLRQCRSPVSNKLSYPPTFS